MSGRYVALALSLVVIAVASPALGGGDDGASGKGDSIPNSIIQEGFAISPIPKAQLNFTRKNMAMAAWGSYLVNGTSDCAVATVCRNSCRLAVPAAMPLPATRSRARRRRRASRADWWRTSTPSTIWLAVGVSGRGPTPLWRAIDAGRKRPTGRTDLDRIHQGDAHRRGYPLREGADGPDLRDRAGHRGASGHAWPSYHNLTDFDLEAIYDYLSALPPAKACNTPADGCPVITDNLHYTYPNTADCPNPPPPQ